MTISSDGVPIEVPAPMLRRLLAVLLCRIPGPVAVAELLDALWAGEPPSTARKTLQVYVHRLRRIVGDERIGHGSAGYVLRIDGHDCDALRFAELVARGRAANRAGQLDVARRLLDGALRLWRGAPYADVRAGELVAAEAARLKEQHLLAQEELVTIELEQGRYPDVLPRLLDLTAAYPYREHLRGQLMVALYHSGRRAEALEVYRRTRALLAGELGVEPIPELRRLHEAILRDDLPAPAHRLAAPTPTPTPSVPRQLPSDVSAFTGRDEALHFLDAGLPTGTGAAAVCAISGMGGVGKTSLAVHWSHRVAAHFPDGQLYADLRGYAPGPPAPPAEVLALFLSGLGVPTQEIPVRLDQAVTMYRTLLADRRILVVLDNARDARQVRPLLPSGPGCLTLVTSRDRLTGLAARDGARSLALDVLPAAESVELLERVFAAADVQVSPADVAELAELCGHLPLALRISAAVAADRADVTGLLGALRGGRALAGLEVDADAEASVRATFELSYRALDPAGQRLFRHLGLVPGRDVTVEAAAALTGDPPPACQRLLDVLAAAHLVTPHRPGRYAVHDLLRQYALELARATDPERARADAVARLCDRSLARVDAAARMLYPTMVRIRFESPVDVPEFADEEAALGWLDDELPNLAALVTHPTEHGPQRAAWLLADALRGYFWIRRHHAQWLAAAEAGLAAARAADDREGQAAAHLSLALAHLSLANIVAATEHAGTALSLAQELDWLELQVSALGNLAVAHAEGGRTRAALERLTEALGVTQRMDDRPAMAGLLGNRATLRFNVGDLAGQIRDARAALEIYAELNSPVFEALVHLGAAEGYLYLGHLEASREHLTTGHTLFARIGDEYGQAVARGLMAKMQCESGDFAGALPHALAGLALSREAGDRPTEARILTDLATIHTHLGQHDQALRDATAAADLARRAQSGHPEVAALTAVAEALRHAGRPHDALAAAHRSLALAEERQYQLLHADALTSITASRLALGDRDGAAASGAAALRLDRSTGYRRRAARTEALLAAAGSPQPVP